MKKTETEFILTDTGPGIARAVWPGFRYFSGGAK
jgi:hypothetical protein